MIHAGDIVAFNVKNLNNSSKTLGVILEGPNSAKQLLISFLDKTRLDSSNLFTVIINNFDLEDGSLEDLNGKKFVLLNKLINLDTSKCQKIGRVKKNKFNEILRTFNHYAGHIYYSSFIESNTRDYIPASGKMMDFNDLFNMIDATLDFWLTADRFDQKFCQKFKEFLGRNYVLTTNSGSSANLLAISSLTSHKLKEKSLNIGDEVITVSACFPTTVAPIVQNGLVPVFVDLDLETYNIDTKQIEESISSKTKAIFVAHTLGNPFDISRILKIAEKHGLWVVEDNCDALGSKYNGQYTGTFGHISTFSFYPAHHITMGEGGAITTNQEDLYKIILSYRDWGRDCYCPPGSDNTCGMRFNRQLGDLPFGYDHKYIYSHLGYNLKITDLQAAVGLSQLNKLPSFIKKRKNNFKKLYLELKNLEDYFYLPKASENSDPSWFGFPLTLKDGVEFKKTDLVNFLENNKIGTRQLFAGNILRQPAFVDVDVELRIRNSGLLKSRALSSKHYQMLPVSDIIMNSTFWLGTWPGIGVVEIEHISRKIKEFLDDLP